MPTRSAGVSWKTAARILVRVAMSDLGILTDEVAALGTVFCGGAWVQGRGKRRLTVRDPASGQIIAEMASASEEQAALAADCAKRAAAEWGKSPADVRAALLRAIASEMRNDAELLSRVIVAEEGKPLREAASEVTTAIDWFEWYAEAALQFHPMKVLSRRMGKSSIISQRPRGVVFAITPWNDPVGMVARKIAPTLAAGCTVIVKPARDTPLSVIALINLIAKAGLPPGVVNLIVADEPARCVSAVLETGAISKVSFTGSTAVGRRIAAQAAAVGVPASLELGGNAPFILLDDADLAAAADAVVLRKFRNAGQGCTCINRLFIHHRVLGDALDLIAERLSDMRLGHGLREETSMGPIIRSEEVMRLERAVEDAQRNGASMVFQGNVPTDPTLRDGTFSPVVMLTSVRDEMAIVRDEIFGPILPVLTFSSDEEVVERANGVEHGLAAYVYSSSSERALRIASELDVGLIGINDASPQGVYYPVGGVKQSGYGVEGGLAGLEEYLTYCSISVKSSDGVEPLIAVSEQSR